MSKAFVRHSESRWPWSSYCADRDLSEREFDILVAASEARHEAMKPRREALEKDLKDAQAACPPDASYDTPEARKVQEAETALSDFTFNETAKGEQIAFLTGARYGFRTGCMLMAQAFSGLGGNLFDRLPFDTTEALLAAITGMAEDDPATDALLATLAGVTDEADDEAELAAKRQAETALATALEGLIKAELAFNGNPRAQELIAVLTANSRKCAAARQGADIPESEVLDAVTRTNLSHELSDLKEPVAQAKAAYFKALDAMNQN